MELYDFFDRPMEVRWKGIALPFRVFNKEQRVTHTAVVENKRLGHALSIVKAQQNVKRETKVSANSEKIGYKKDPRAIYGQTSSRKRVRAPRWNDGLMEAPKNSASHITHRPDGDDELD